MKKRTITITFALTLCLSIGAFSACSDTTQYISDAESQVSSATSESSVDNTTTTDEATENISETVTSSTDESGSEIGDNSESETTTTSNSPSYNTAYKAFMNHIDTIEAAKDGEYLYGFVMEYGVEGADVPYILVASKIGSNEVSQFISVDGQIKEDHTSIYDGPTLTYETIKKLPVLAETYFFSEETKIYDSVEDGLYYGSISAISLDGTKVLASFGKPVIISKEQYDSFKVGDNLGEVLGIQELSDEYYTYNSNGYFGDDYEFQQYKDGNEYILYGPSDYVINYDGRLAFMEINSDCSITDNFIWLVDSENYDQTSVAGSLAKTYFYNDMTSADGMHGQYYPNHNGWTHAYAIMEPVVVKDGSIVDITLGWR